MRVLAIDPTATGSGGAVVRGPNGFVVAFSWTQRNSGTWCVKSRRHGHPTFVMLRDVASLCNVGELLASCEGIIDRVVLELIEPSRVPSRRTKRATEDLIKLAEGAGETIAPLRGVAPLYRVAATEWRAVLGESKSSGRDAEDAAIREARRQGILRVGLNVAEQGAISEANAMAMWAERAY